MNEILQRNDTNEKVIYPFRFTPSSKSIRLSQQQLDKIPYLSAFVAHKNDFLPCQNENGEYILDHRINYNSFVAILHSINSEQPYSLFAELPEDENILDTLQLFDYFGINPFSLPLLKGKELMLSNPCKSDDKKRTIEYRPAYLSEARNTAAEFLMAIYKNEYNLLDRNTMMKIFALIMTIIYQRHIFSSRFRCHTVTIAKEYCFPFLTPTQQYEIIFTHNEIQKERRLNSLKYFYSDNDTIIYNEHSVFNWKGVYTSPKEDSVELPFRYNEFNITSCSTLSRSLFLRKSYPFKPIEPLRLFETWECCQEHPTKKISQSTLLKSCNNKLLKRSDVDKLKHPVGRKTQKYR